jgi:hypothetical protein
MKVEYRTRGGVRSTAYVDLVAENVVEGSDKYTGDLVRLTWTGSTWRETEG